MFGNILKSVFIKKKHLEVFFFKKNLGCVFFLKKAYFKSSRITIFIFYIFENSYIPNLSSQIGSFDTQFVPISSLKIFLKIEDGEIANCEIETQFRKGETRLKPMNPKIFPKSISKSKP